MLLVAALEVCIRLEECTLWPFQAWRSRRQYNPHGSDAFCMILLSMPAELLDLGFGRTLALQSGSELNGLRYLMSEGAQKAIVSGFEASAASSLPAERAFAEAKRSESPRLCHVATAGRKHQIRQHLRQRQDLLEAAERSVAQLRRSMIESVQSLHGKHFPIWPPQPCT